MSMPSLRGQRRLLVSGAVVILLGVTGTIVSGQAPPFQGGLPNLVEQILQSLTGLQGSSDDLQDSVDALQQAVNGLSTATQSPVRFTAKAFFRHGVADCAAVNVSNAPRHIQITMVNGGTGATLTSDNGILATAAGASRSAGIASSFFTGSIYCKFNVLDGTGADIRGNMIFGASLADDATLLSIEAE